MKKLLLLILLPFILQGATVTLIDGSKISGEIISSTDESVELQTQYSNEPIIISQSKVIDISFTEESTQPKLNVMPVSNNSNIRYVANDISDAGKELSAFTKQYYTGFWVQVIGLLFMLSADNESTGSIGTIAYMTGGIIQFVSHSHIGRAGIKLQDASEELEDL